MSVHPDRPLVDVRALPGTRETVAYKDGGLFPVLTIAPDGTVVAVLRGAAGHLGLAGRIEIVRSGDGGLTWTPPSVVADSECDDRNPALGVSQRGTLLLSYHRQCSYDEQGRYLDRNHSSAQRRVEVMVTRSEDAGLTWEKPAPMDVEPLRTGSAFGKIASLADGTLLMAVYREDSYLVRSHDDGKSWGDPSLIAAGMNETGLLALPSGDILAVMRSWEEGAALFTTRSSDGGRSWSAPVQVTDAGQHPADLVLLANGDVLLCYGNRNPPYRVEGLVSRDGGRSWVEGLLTFSGALYGYNVEERRPTDLGYPSSVVARESGRGLGVTMYYYNPSIRNQTQWIDRETGTGYLAREGEARYSAQDYLAVAVTWAEEELIHAVDSLLPRRE